MWWAVLLSACSGSPEPLTSNALPPPSEAVTPPEPPVQPDVSVGVAAFLDGDFVSAERTIRAAGDEWPPRVQLHLGVAMLAQGKTMPGLKVITGAVDRVAAGTDADAKLLRNVGAAVAGKPPPIPWDAVLAEQPDDYIARWLRGALSRTASVEDRLAWYDAAIALDGEPLLGWIGKVTLLQQAGRRAEAVAVFDAAAGACGANPELWRLRAQHHLVDGDYDATAAALQQVLPLDTSDAASRGLLVRVEELAGRPDQVAALRSELDSAPPADRQAWLERLPAHVLALGGAPSEALAAAEACGEAALAEADGRSAVRCGYEALRVWDHTRVEGDRVVAFLGRLEESVDGTDKDDAQVLRTWVALMSSGSGDEAARAALPERDLMQTGMWVKRRRLQQLVWAAAEDPLAAEAAARAAEPAPSRCDDAWALAVALDKSGRETAEALDRLAAVDGPCPHDGWGKARRVDGASRRR